MDLISMYSGGNDNQSSGSLLDQYAGGESAGNSLLDQYAGKSESLVDSYSDINGYSTNHAADMGQGLDSEGNSAWTRKGWVAGEEKDSAGLMGQYEGLNTAIKTHLRNDISRSDAGGIDAGIADMLFNEADSPIDDIIGRRVDLMTRAKTQYFATSTLSLVATSKLMDKTGIGTSGISSFAEGKDGDSIDQIGDTAREGGDLDWENANELSSFEQNDWTKGPDIFADPYEEKKSDQQESFVKKEDNVFFEASSQGIQAEDILSGKKAENPFDKIGLKTKDGRSVSDVLSGSGSNKSKYIKQENQAEEESGDPSETKDEWSNQKDSWSEESDQQNDGELLAPIALFAGTSIAEKLASQKTVSEELTESFEKSKELKLGKSVSEEFNEAMNKKRYRSDVPELQKTSVNSDEFLLRVKKEEKGSPDLRSIAGEKACNAGLVGCEDDEASDELRKSQQKIIKSVFAEKDSIEYKIKKLEEKLTVLGDDELEKQRILMSKKHTPEAQMILHMIVSMQQSRKISEEIRIRNSKKIAQD